MNWKNGNIWFWHRLGSTIVIPTNAGYKITRQGNQNVMGAGLAKEASKEFPNLALEYGELCHLENPCVWMQDYRIILVPSKVLIKDKPWQSWMAPATVERVTESLRWLQKLVEADSKSFEKNVYVPLIGAGNGQLDEEIVKELMEKVLVHTLFIGVTWDSGLPFK